MHPLPFIAPNPPRLSEEIAALRRIEASGVFSNNGPEVRAFEAEATATLFDGRGASLAVGNATLGLMIAIRDAAGPAPKPGTLALMPALTFAATAQAAIWAGLTPLVCDVDPDDWSACAEAENRLIARYGTRIAVVVPYATFGNAIDLDRYAWLQARRGIGVVVDAAASLGTRDIDGGGFGASAPFAIVHSMHATKPFAVAEGGLIHSGDAALVERLRAMANFGFESGRTATLPGLNAKLPEILAMMARAKLGDFEAVCTHRTALETAYRAELHGFGLQRVRGTRRAVQFMPVLLPERLTGSRDVIIAAMAAEDIGCGAYFSPHLGEQPWFRTMATIAPTPVADALSRRILSLPVSDTMTVADATRAARALVRLCRRTPARATARRTVTTMVIGGGPAGTALLTAAAKHGLLGEFAADLVLVERGGTIGDGRLGDYAITSDSTAQTFLSAVRDNGHPELAALADHPAGRAVAAHAGALGVPLTEVGAFLRATGDALGEIVRASGGSVLTGHEALGATRAGTGSWRVRLRRLSDGHEFERTTRNLVIATGGHQPFDRLATQQLAGERLIDLADGRLLRSDDVLRVGGFAEVADRLAGKRSPRIAVIGGSTSAVTTIVQLLKGDPALPLGAGAITLLHRRPLRPFYPSAQTALAEGFTDFRPEDVCPVSGFVYRLAGFRLEARELVLRMLGIDGRVADPRVTLHRIAGDDKPARDIVRRADLVVAATGYRPLALPVAEASGTAITLSAHAGGAMVDRDCRVVDASGAAIPGLFGIGLAAGFLPSGRLGGEASFSGQANGLWLWQNDVGAMIVDQILGERVRAAA